MGDEERPDVPEASTEGRLIIPPAAGQIVTRAGRFSREAVATMISLATAAFGLVAALAWNTAITGAFAVWLKNHDQARISALFIYAVIVTLIGVTVIVLLSRVATRINAEPIEFKYPGTPKT
jgi:hypothetical protein